MADREYLLIEFLRNAPSIINNGHGRLLDICAQSAIEIDKNNSQIAIEFLKQSNNIIEIDDGKWLSICAEQIKQLAGTDKDYAKEFTTNVGKYIKNIGDINSDYIPSILSNWANLPFLEGD